MTPTVTQHTKRFYVQLGSLFLLHSNWGPEVLKGFCNPVLSCHSCPLSWFACPIGVFIHFSGYHVFPFFALGTVLFLGALFGRLFCGWVCPFGFLQDLLYKIPSRKIQIPHWSHQVKYLVLLLGVFLLPYYLGEMTSLSFCRICPAAALQVTAPGLIQGWAHPEGAVFWAKAAVLLFVLMFAVLHSRFFCKVICPIGALLAPLNLLSLWVVKPPTSHCVICRKCCEGCPTDVKPTERILKGIPPSRTLDCVLCHECQTVCPVPDKPVKTRRASSPKTSPGEEPS